MEQQAEIRIDGMSCGGCVANVTRKLQAVAGVQSVDVQLQPGLAKVHFDDAATSLAALESVIDEAGFEVVRG